MGCATGDTDGESILANKDKTKLYWETKMIDSQNADKNNDIHQSSVYNSKASIIVEDNNESDVTLPERKAVDDVIHYDPPTQRRYNDVQTDNPQETLIEREIRQQRERELPCTSCKRLRIRSNSRKKSRKKRRQTPRRDAGPDSGHPEGYPHP